MHVEEFQPKSDLRKEKIKDKFIAVAKNTPLYYNRHREDNKIIGEKGTRIDVSKDNVKITKVTKENKHAHMHSPWSREKDEERIVLGVNPKHWNLDMKKENEVTILAHEFYHLKYGNHKPKFWRILTDALCRMYERRDNLKEAWSNPSRRIPIRFNWEKVFEHQLKSIHEGSVDNRMTCKKEQRIEVIKKIYEYANVSEEIERLVRSN